MQIAARLLKFPQRLDPGYVVTGMLTRGKWCEDGILCAPKLSEVVGGKAVYPAHMADELKANVGDFWIDCSRMPAAVELKGREAQVVTDWLDQISRIRSQQTRLFEYLLAHHPTDFTMFVQSCEDRVGHWLYPIQPHNVGYSPSLHTVRLDAFPDQYRAFDQVLGKVLPYVDADTYLFVLSDQFAGRRLPSLRNTTLKMATNVPGTFIAMGPKIRRAVRLMGFDVTIFDIAPTILSVYGIPVPNQMKPRAA